jgi:anti-anti-sigma factor
MELYESIVGEVAVVAVTGRIDSSTAPQLSRTLAQTLAARGARLVLDLSATQYLSSAGLRVLLQVAKQIDVAKGKLVLHGLNDRVSEVLDISGFLAEMIVCTDRSEAIAAASE